MSCTASLTHSTALYSIYSVSQSDTRAESRVYQEGVGDTRPLVAQQKEVRELAYKGTWTTNISVSKKVTERNIYSLPVSKHQNNITVY